MKDIEKLLNIDEVSDLIGLSQSTIYKMVNTKRIPYVKVGRLVKFEPSKIRLWIEQNSVEISN